MRSPRLISSNEPYEDMPKWMEKQYIRAVAVARIPVARRSRSVLDFHTVNRYFSSP
jgi:hypothetical protein